MKSLINSLAPIIALFVFASCAAQTQNPKTDSTKIVPKQDSIITVAAAPNPLTHVYGAYFALKDALVQTNGSTAATQAKTLFKAIDSVEMGAMSAAQHTVWMKYQQKLSYDAEHIKGVTDTEHQREHFASLSKNMYEVMKVINPDTTVYYDYCPMYNKGKGANWLSMEKVIENPYYGNTMLSCGRVTETLK